MLLPCYLLRSAPVDGAVMLRYYVVPPKANFNPIFSDSHFSTNSPSEQSQSLNGNLDIGRYYAFFDSNHMIRAGNFSRTMSRRFN